MEGFLKSGKLGGGPLKPKPKKIDAEKKAALVPWVEKYRPRTVEDVAYQDEVVAVLRKSIENLDLPNMLFYGPPGTGKTSTILAASRQLFGDMYRSRVLELNASDERGIAVIREKVKTFAQVAVSSTREDGKPCPGFKIIILDEADSMTKDAQSALRRTMEKESHSTRFCLICNYVSRIIGPLTSRCSKFRFKPLKKESIITRLELIAKAEGLQCDESALDALVETSDGDMRRAITLLQCAVKLKVADTVQAQDIYEASGVIPDKWISDLFSACASGYKDIESFTDALLVEGYSSAQLLVQIHKYVIDNDQLTDNHKSVIAQKIAECDARLLEGADEYLQIMDLACTVMTQLKK